MENENKYEGLYIIGYGLGGGFGGMQTYEVVQCETLAQAEDAAYEAACEHYQMYEGMHGLRDVEQIMEEDEIEEEQDAWGIYEEERESWLEYSATKYSKEYEEEVSGYNYHNPYKEITDK